MSPWEVALRYRSTGAHTMSVLASIKLSKELVDDARHDAAAFQRSVGGQVEHWARIGRAVESAPGTSLSRVRAALEGRFDPNDLNELEWPIFDELQFDALLADNVDTAAVQAKAVAAYAKLGARPGAVGDDESGRLTRVRDDGSIEYLD